MTSEHGNIMPAHISVPLLALGGARVRFENLAVKLLPLITDQEEQDALRGFFEQAVHEIDCAISTGVAEVVKDWTAEERIQTVKELFGSRVQIAGLLTPGPDSQDTVH